jgi:hypothetical protein
VARSCIPRFESADWRDAIGRGARRRTESD